MWPMEDQRSHRGSIGIITKNGGVWEAAETEAVGMRVHMFE